MDPYKILRVSRNPDGTLTRESLPLAAPTGDVEDPSLPALSKDVPLSAANETWMRVFRPNRPPPSAAKRLPVIIYFHGGGFVLFSAAWTFFHDSCARFAAQLPAVVVSVEYRLAPEHRLPAAYDDAVDALFWVRKQSIESNTADPWLREYADFSRCYLMGSSAGGNIAYHAALRALELDLEPVKLAGVILNQAYFGGVERTESEKRLADDRIIPLPVNDLLWELSLPEGSDRDHEYGNVTLRRSGGAAVARLPRCMVRGYAGDPLLDRQKEVAKMLEREGVSVVTRFYDEGFHGVEVFDLRMAEKIIAELKDFVVHGGGQKM